MAAKFEIEKFNGNNFSLSKLKMKAIHRKDKCLAAIGERPSEVTDDRKWDKMDGNAIANLHLALADGVLSSIEEKKSAKEIWDHLARLYELTSLSCKIDSQERAEILLQSLPDSYDQVIINLTSNVLSDSLVFDDVATAILEEENRHNNREDKQTSSRQVEALVVIRGMLMEPAPVRVTIKENVASTSEDGDALCCEASVKIESRKRFADVWRIVRIKSLLDVVWITAAHVCVNAAQLELVLLRDFKENMLTEVNVASENMLEVTTTSEYQVNAASWYSLFDMY
ncbi:hypothetical protein Tco_0195778 [Tanacetum coccineum]